jgi:hypothetical protein
MAPQTTQRTSLHEKSHPYTWTIMDRISFYAEDETFHIEKQKIKGKSKIKIDWI